MGILKSVLFWIIVVFVSLVYIMSPQIFRSLGLYPSYTPEEKFNLYGRKVLIVATSHGKTSSGKSIGAILSEIAIPYYVLSRSGIKVDVASIDGGKIPLEPFSLSYTLKSTQDRALLKESTFKAHLNYSLPLDSVDITSYDAIILAGGRGATFDFMDSKTLQSHITYMLRTNKPVATIGLGIYGLNNIIDGSKGILQHRKVTTWTNSQVEEMRFSNSDLSMLPQNFVKNRGGNYSKGKSVFDSLPNSYVLVDGNLVMGQNQNASEELSHKVIKLMAERLGVKAE